MKLNTLQLMFTMTTKSKSDPFSFSSKSDP